MSIDEAMDSLYSFVDSELRLRSDGSGRSCYTRWLNDQSECNDREPVDPGHCDAVVRREEIGRERQRCRGDYVWRTRRRQWRRREEREQMEEETEKFVMHWKEVKETMVNEA